MASSTYTYIRLSGSSADRRKKARSIARNAGTDVNGNNNAQRGKMAGKSSPRFQVTKEGSYRGSIVRFK